ncbi:MAG: NAD(P)H-hydrate dehydratase [Acidobacteriota bacterium]|nr:NAD(P)H-hydrate dehydratase [Acidobacteriota bacterium]
MIPILDARRMRAADAAAIRGGIRSSELMENAADALVDEIRERFAGWSRIVVACGPGNNGGDGLAAARLLAAGGASIALFSLNPPSGYRGDAKVNAGRAVDAGLEIVSLASRGGWTRFRDSLDACDGVVDALFGTGLSRALRGRAARAVAAIAGSARPVLSADVPSGLSSDSGSPPGVSIAAACTVALAAPKLCHVLPPARGRCGFVVVRDIGIPRPVLDRQRSRVRLVEREDVARLLPPRPLDSNKADFGRLAIIAGSRGKAGAAVLAARGALRAGAGLVTIFCPESIESIAVSAIPEAMTRGLPERGGALAPEAATILVKALAGFDAAVAGPGLSGGEGVRSALSAVLRLRLPLVCDADALNVFSGDPAAFSRRRASTVLTPHPGEAGRLLSLTSRQIQADRLAAATRLAKEARSIAVLKGEGTLTAAPTGRVTVNSTGTPLLSAPGSGDVLAGMIGAYLAAGMPAEDAAIAAVYVHGAAGQRLASVLGDTGMMAGELADALPGTRLALSAAATPRT